MGNIRYRQGKSETRVKKLEIQKPVTKATIDPNVLKKYDKELDELRSELENLKVEFETLKHPVESGSMSVGVKGFFIGAVIAMFVFLLLNAKRDTRLRSTEEKLTKMQKLLKGVIQEMETLVENSSQAEIEPLLRRFEAIENRLKGVTSTHRSTHKSEIIYLAEKGYTAQEIAKRLGITKGEVELVLNMERTLARHAK